MNKIVGRQTVERAQQNQWVGEVNLTATKIELGMRTLEAVSNKDAKIPGGLASSTLLATTEACDMLKTMLEQRFDVLMTEADISTLHSASQTLNKARSHYLAIRKKADQARIPPGASKHETLYVHVNEAAKELSFKANASGSAQFMDANGTYLIVKPNQDPQEAVTDWRNAQKRMWDSPVGDMAREVENRAEAAARQNRLEKFIAQGGKIIDTPPDGMTLDPNGLLMVDGEVNKSKRPLQCITEAQLNQLPDGTKLTCIDGSERVKGIDNIDDETRAGFIAFGFLQ